MFHNWHNHEKILYKLLSFYFITKIFITKILTSKILVRQTSKISPSTETQNHSTHPQHTKKEKSEKPDRIFRSIVSGHIIWNTRIEPCHPQVYLCPGNNDRRGRDGLAQTNPRYMSVSWPICVLGSPRMGEKRRENSRKSAVRCSPLNVRDSVFLLKILII